MIGICQGQTELPRCHPMGWLPSSVSGAFANQFFNPIEPTRKK
jgi:hypothetical protein